MKFTLEIELGNDAMRTMGDILHALKNCGTHGTVRELDNDESQVLIDRNGNTVGKWEVTA